MSFQTEFEFSLKKGLIGRDGKIRKKGLMRLSTAADEILPLNDRRVQANQAYLTMILLSRVITEMEDLKGQDIDPKLMESLFVSDLAYLKAFYEKINSNGRSSMAATCPNCDNKFEIDLGWPE
jgi:hypothetical protein